MADADILDLNDLIPQPRIIKNGDQEFEVKPPTTAQVLKLGVLGSKMQDLANLKDDEIESLVSDLTDTIRAIIPELGATSFNTTQLMALLNLIMDMGMPKEAKELQARGITKNTPKTKA